MTVTKLHLLEGLLELREFIYLTITCILLHIKLFMDRRQLVILLAHQISGLSQFSCKIRNFKVKLSLELLIVNDRVLELVLLNDFTIVLLLFKLRHSGLNQVR